MSSDSCFRTRRKKKNFYDFREKWDFEDVTEKEFKAIKLEINKYYYKPIKN